MTKFLTFYKLCPLYNPTDFLGLSCDREEGKIIITFGRNIVGVIQLNNQKQVRSWTTLEKLSSQVVYDFKSEKYVGVFGNNSIRRWNKSDLDINKIKKLKFKKQIVDLVAYMQTTLVIYADGSCEELNTAIESRKNEDTTKLQLDSSSDVTITYPKISNFTNGRKCLTMFEKNQSQETFTLIKIDFDSTMLPNTSSEAQRIIIKRENLNVNIAGYAVIDGDDGPIMVTIWSDKRIFLLNLSDPLAEEKSPGNFVSILGVLKVDTPLSIVGLSQHFIAIYGANNTQEGASLLLYNTQFKVIKAQQFFKIYFDMSRLWTSNGHILLPLGQHLYVVSYRITKELLSDFVGAQAVGDFEVAIESDHINEEDTFPENIQFVESESASYTKSLKPAKKDSRKTVHADGLTVPFEPLSDFEKDFSALKMSHVYVDLIEADESCCDDIQTILMSNVHDSGFVTNEIQTIATELEKCGASEHEISEKLLFLLIKSNLLHDIAICLRRYKNISEKMLAKTLKYILNNILIEINSNSETEECSPNHDNIEENGENVEVGVMSSKELLKEQTDVLSVILCCSFDTVALSYHLRKELDYPQVLYMLNFLYNILASDSDDDEDDIFERECIDIESTVFRWFGIFLHTHFQKLALSGSEQLMEILHKWHELFALYKKQIIELEQVAAILYNLLQHKTTIKDKNYTKSYFIEEVDLY